MQEGGEGRGGGDAEGEKEGLALLLFRPGETWL